MAGGHRRPDLRAAPLVRQRKPGSRQSGAGAVDFVMTTPAVTVLMPVYNGAAHLREAVDSILDQTFTDFEFLVVDDGSTDGTPEILAKYARKDARIRVERNEKNLRIAASLNKGLELASAPLIARMDADDVSLPDRLEKQIAFMREHPEVTVCGGALQLYDHPEELWTPPLEDRSIRAFLFFSTCMYHPLVMFRRDVVLRRAGGYALDMPPAEDYDLWVRLAGLPGVRLANLPDVLLRYRVTDKPPQYRERQQEMADQVRARLLRRIGLEPTSQYFAAYSAVRGWRRDLSAKELWACGRWMTKLRSHAAKAGWCSDEVLQKELRSRWEAMCVENTRTAAAGLIYFSSGLGMASWATVKHFIKAVLKKFVCRM